MESGPVHGELLVVPERVVLAPTAGRFRPAGPAGDGDAAPDGRLLAEEEVIGFIDGTGHSTPVRSAFSGFFMGLLAHAGERVREGQPVAWLRLAT
jgi:biotin carboxyl carrier protein